MNRTTCPFIGLKEDPETALDFPSEGNFCHHARPVTPVSRAYQESFCLTTDHISCPIFKAAQTQPIALVAEAFPRATVRQLALSRRTMAVVGLPVLLAGAVAISLFWNTLAAPFGLAGLGIARTGGDPATPMSWALVMTSTTSPENAAEPTPSDPTTVTNCPLPSGWIPYMVNPTDSLYRLSVIYGVSVDQLQSANCMGNNTVIFPGQEIYVPDIPTNTPTFTETPVPLPTDTLVPVSNNSGPAQPVAQKPPQNQPTSTPVPPGSSPDPKPSATSKPPDPHDHGGGDGKGVGNGGSHGHHNGGGGSDGNGGNQGGNDGNNGGNGGNGGNKGGRGGNGGGHGHKKGK